MLAVLSNVGRVVPEWLRERLCEGAGVCKRLIVTARVVVFGVWWVAAQDYYTWISFAGHSLSEADQFVLLRMVQGI